MEQKKITVFIYLPNETVAVPAGIFSHDADAGIGSFSYGRRYIERINALPVDPIALPIGPSPGEVISNGGIYGAFRDASPDYWGRLIIAMEAKVPPEAISELDFLLASNGTRVGNLDFRLSPDDPEPDLQPPHFNQLTDVVLAAEKIEMGEQTEDHLLQLLRQGTSMGGARPKCTVEWNEALWIAKFPARGDTLNIPRIEYATMTLAGRCGIDIPKVHLVTVGDKDIYLCRRFDREKPGAGWRRSGFLSALSLMQWDEGDRIHWDYAAIADTMRRRMTVADIHALYRRMIFNILVRNTDDHPRNHGFLVSDQTKMAISPAYDIISAPAHPGVGTDFRLAMAVGESGREATLENALSRPERFGLVKGEAQVTIEHIFETVRAWREVFEECGVSGPEIDLLAPSFPEMAEIKTNPEFNRQKPDMRFFNTAGIVNCHKHYCLPPLERFDLEEIENLIAQEKYFILHAPRQTGKTTCMLALMEYLNNKEDYNCVYANVEAAQGARENVFRGIRAILNEISEQAARQIHDNFMQDRWTDVLHKSGEDAGLRQLLTVWAEYSSKPTVLIIDEIDALIGDTLISVLRQIRAGYSHRPESFPQSIILCGIRDIRDYRIHSDRDKSIITGGSAFNIKAKSLRLDDFTHEEVKTLLQQHTEYSGQIFEHEAIEMIWQLTMGQPWLVNALAYEVCFEIKGGRDRDKPITEEIIIQAKENFIIRRETHLDQLADKLREERVRKLILPFLNNTQLEHGTTDDDISYLVDLGLIRKDINGYEIANPIYREIIPRQLTTIFQANFESSQRQAWYIDQHGRLDIAKLISAFQEFFREHSEHWIERFDYREAGPQLLLQAFLQRVVNGGGRVEREYGLGRMRTDLLLIWPYEGGKQRVVIELKLLHKSLKKTMEDGSRQTASYMERCGTGDGHLIIFDRREAVSWDEKIFQKKIEYNNYVICVWGC